MLTALTLSRHASGLVISLSFPSYSRVCTNQYVSRRLSNVYDVSLGSIFTEVCHEHLGVCCYYLVVAVCIDKQGSAAEVWHEASKWEYLS